MTRDARLAGAARTSGRLETDGVDVEPGLDAAGPGRAGSGLTRHGRGGNAEDVADAPTAERLGHAAILADPRGVGDQGQVVPPGEAATVLSPLAQIRNVPSVELEYL